MRRKGIALVATLAVTLFIAVLVFGAFFTTQLEIWTTRNDTTANQAFAVAQAGIQKYKTLAFQAFRYYLENADTYGSELARYAQCGNMLVIGLDLNRDGTIDSANDLGNGNSRTEEVTFPDGSKGKYTVSFSASGSYVTLRSVGEYAGARSTVTAVVKVSSKGLFSNAIATGLGSGVMNGNMEVWGSVYVNASNPTDFVIGSSGAFKMHNYYTRDQLANIFGNRWTADQISQFLKLQAMEQRDMCATLSVTGGKVKIWGNSQIGDSALPSGLSASDGWNPKVDGIYVGEGRTGNQCNNVSSAPDVCVGGGANYYATNGIRAFPYQNPPPIPSLDTTPCKADTSQTWRQCLRSQASTEGVVLIKGQNLPSWCTLNVNRGTIVFGRTNMSCLQDGKGFTYTYDSSTQKGQLTVYGMVNFRGYDLEFKEDVVVRYTNKATLVVESQGNEGGSVTLDGDLLPERSFPDQDVLGIVTEKTLTITGDTQNVPGTPQKQVVMGLFYAGEGAIVQQNSTVFGTIIAKTVCTSSNCTAGSGNVNIVQVPGLEFNLPPGFDKIPNASSAFFGQLTYERR
jgi:hypothetical protein